MASFKTLRDNAYRNIFLSEDYFGERVLLIREYGRAEDGTVAQALIDAARAADSYITVSISEVEEDPATSGGSFDREEEIWVQCCRSESAVNSAGDPLGGIAQPNIHDAILRDTTKDPLQLPYGYTHELKDSSDVLWRLMFSRRLQGVQGIGV